MNIIMHQNLNTVDRDTTEKGFQPGADDGRWTQDQAHKRNREI